MGAAEGVMSARPLCVPPSQLPCCQPCPLTLPAAQLPWNAVSP